MSLVGGGDGGDVDVGAAPEPVDVTQFGDFGGSSVGGWWWGPHL